MIKEELREKVIKLRKAGLSFNEIYDITGIAKSSISSICRPLNLGGNIIKELTPEIINKAQELYNSIGNIKKVAKMLPGIGYSRLIKVIHLNNNRLKITKSESVIAWRKRTKLKLVEYKGGKCQCCGYSKCIEALEFHHIDTSNKAFSISGKSKSFENLKKEVDKCILVCSNCHKEIHAGFIDLKKILDT